MNKDRVRWAAHKALAELEWIEEEVVPRKSCTYGVLASHFNKLREWLYKIIGTSDRALEPSADEIGTQGQPQEVTTAQPEGQGDPSAAE